MALNWKEIRPPFFAHLYWVDGGGLSREVRGEVTEIAYGEDGDQEITVRRLFGGEEVTLLASEIDSTDLLEIEDIEVDPSKHEQRLPHPLPEDIRAHIVQRHGYSLQVARRHSVDSLLLTHTELHHVAEQAGTSLGHIHGLSARERQAFDDLSAKGWR